MGHTLPTIIPTAQEGNDVTFLLPVKCHYLAWASRCFPIPLSLWDHNSGKTSLWPHGLYSPWNSLGQSTRVGSLSLLQGIFPAQESNPGLPHCRQILYQLSHKGSPRSLEWVAYPFSSRSSWPRNWTGVSCIAGKFFTSWATREAPKLVWTLLISALTGFMSSLCIYSPAFSPNPTLSTSLFSEWTHWCFKCAARNLMDFPDQICPDLFCILGTDTPVIFSLVLLTYNWQRALYV